MLLACVIFALNLGKITSEDSSPLSTSLCLKIREPRCKKEKEVMKKKAETSSRLFSARVVVINVYCMLYVRMNSLKGGTVADLIERVKERERVQKFVPKYLDFGVVYWVF